jgi:glucose-6-phosphate isomerase
MTPREQLPSWQALHQHADVMATVSLREIFARDEQRFEQFSLRLPHALFDYSKQRITRETFAALMRLARDTNVEQWRARLFRGDAINVTENRPVLHTALRAPAATPLVVNGTDVNQQVHHERQRIAQLVADVHGGRWCGFDGSRITDVVNLGVGGSHLGPQTVAEALSGHYDSHLRVHYVSNVDQQQLRQTLSALNPASTLFIVSSKTFTTTETLSNARAAQLWLQSQAPENANWSRQFVAVTAAPERAQAFGIQAEAIFRFWDWVGGRFSLWSAIGLPIALQFGEPVFAELLNGAHEMDRHFCEAPLEQNAPVIMAMLAVWNCTFLNTTLHAMLPYNQGLHSLPAYLQQAEMESNGKSVNWQGQAVSYNTVACLWGGLGINGQHAYYQFLHQGNVAASCDFIAAINSVDDDNAHTILLANMLAQSQALMEGVDEASVRRELLRAELKDDQITALWPHKVHRGDRVSSTILLDQLDAHHLGYLLAMYEHKVFVQGIVLQVYSFDQWGVELGKKIANQLQSPLQQRGEFSGNASTGGQIAYIHSKRIKQRGSSVLNYGDTAQEKVC